MNKPVGLDEQTMTEVRLGYRWYKGKRRCRIASDISALKTVKVLWDDGTCDIVPVRMCWRKRKGE